MKTGVQEAKKGKWPKENRMRVYVLELIPWEYSILGYRLKEWMEESNPRREAKKNQKVRNDLANEGKTCTSIQRWSFARKSDRRLSAIEVQRATAAIPLPMSLSISISTSMPMP